MRTFALAGAILSVWTSAAPLWAQFRQPGQISQYAQPYAQPTQPYQSNQPISFSTDQLIPTAERAHDFGAVARAAKTEHRFAIHNPFDQPMHLRSISASCGCTTPIIETEWIKPGETGSVLARFNTGTFNGDRKATLNLSIDQPRGLQVQLNVKGYIRTDIVINPGELNFGAVPEGESKQIDANVEYAGRNDWKITDITSNDEFIDAQFEEISRKPGRITYKITARLAPGASTGTQATQLVLHTNDARLKSVPLVCSAQIQAPLTVNPDNLALGETRRGLPFQQRLLVKGTKPFRIVEVTAPNMEVRFEPIEEPKQIQFLNLILLPDETMPSGDFRTSLTIRTDLEGDREVKVELSYKLTDAKSDVVRPDEFNNKVSSRSRKFFMK